MEYPHHRARHARGQQVDKQPRQTAFEGLRPRRERALFAVEADHLLHVLGLLFDGDGEHVVARDDAGHAAFLVQYRQPKKMIMLKPADHFLLIIGDVHVFYFAIHDVGNLYFIIRKNQVANGHHADEFLFLVGDEQVIDVRTLLLAMLLPDAFVAFAHGLMRAQCNEPVVHDAARAVLRILQQYLGGGGFLGAHLAQQARARGFLQLAQYVGRFLGVHRVEQRHEFGLRKFLEEIGEDFILQLSERGGRIFHRQFLQDMARLFGFHALQPIG